MPAREESQSLLPTELGFSVWSSLNILLSEGICVRGQTYFTVSERSVKELFAMLKQPQTPGDHALDLALGTTS